MNVLKLFSVLFTFGRGYWGQIWSGRGQNKCRGSAFNTRLVSGRVAGPGEVLVVVLAALVVTF